jgi:hypothetical protein
LGDLIQGRSRGQIVRALTGWGGAWRAAERPQITRAARFSIRHAEISQTPGMSMGCRPMTKKRLLIPAERIERAILLVRGHKVLLDRDLAELYGIETRVLVQAVKRNTRRFPEDFMFQLSKDELESWRSQFVMSNPAAKMGLRRRPYAFTEQGVAMLSSVLHSNRAIDVNIAIMRTFVRLRRLLLSHRQLARRFDQLENKYDSQFKIVFEAIRQLMSLPPGPPKRRIGFARD